MYCKCGERISDIEEVLAADPMCAACHKEFYESSKYNDKEDLDLGDLYED